MIKLLLSPLMVSLDVIALDDIMWATFNNTSRWRREAVQDQLGQVYMAKGLIVAGILFLLVSANLLAQTPAGKNPIVGTWRLNLEKSKFESGPPPKGQTRQYSQRRDGLIVANIWSINAQGNPSFTQTVSKYDGKEYGQYNQTTLETFQATGTQTGTTQAFAVIDSYTVDITNKVDGRVTTTSRRTVSEDGKTMTHVVKGTDARGNPYTNVLMFDRVQ